MRRIDHDFLIRTTKPKILRFLETILTRTTAAFVHEHVHDHVNVHVNVHELPPDLMSDVDVVVDVHVVVLGSFICGSAAPRRSAKSV